MAKTQTKEIPNTIILIQESSTSVEGSFYGFAYRMPVALIVDKEPLIDASFAPIADMKPLIANEPP